MKKKVKLIVFLSQIIFLLLSCQTLKSDLIPIKGVKPYYNEELNFKFTIPEGFIELNLNKLNSNIALSYMRSSPVLSFFIQAEKNKLNLDLDTMIANSKNEMLKRTKEVKIIDEYPLMINNMEGYCFTAEVTLLKKVKLYYMTWLYQNNGYMYHLVVYSMAQYEKQVKQDAPQIFTLFNQIDPQRSAVIDQAEIDPSRPDNYQSSCFNYTINFQQSDFWIPYDDINQINPIADAGGIYNPDTLFLVIPFIIGKKEARAETIAYVLLAELGFDFKKDRFKNRKKITEGEFSGFVIQTERKIEQEHYAYLFKILINDYYSYLIAVWKHKNDQGLTEYADTLYRLIEIDKNPPEHVKYTDFSPSQLKGQATLFNQLGIYYYQEDNDYPRSLESFKNAFNLDDRNPDYLANALQCYFTLNQYQTGLGYLELMPNEVKEVAKVRLQKARFLQYTGHSEEAYQIYQELFPQETEDVFFSEYLNLIIKKKDLAEAERVYQVYTGANPSLSVGLEYARQLYENQRYTQSINLLLDLAEKFYFTEQIGYLLINNYNAVGDYKNALQICERLLNENIMTALTYYLKGETEYNLKWYRESKLSLDKAYAMAQKETAIKELLDIVSGMIGEGYNSLVKEEMAPVPLPEELLKNLKDQQELPEFKNYSAYYQYYVKGYSYRKHQELKFTIYKKIKILDQTGVSKFSTLDFTFNPLLKKVYVNELIVRDEDGNIVSQGNPDDYYLIDKQNNENADFDKTLNLPVPHLTPGNTIELTLTVQFISEAGEFMFAREFLSGLTPSLISALYVAGDIDELSFDCINTGDPVRFENTYLWQDPNPPVILVEPNLADVENYAHIILLTEKRDQWTPLVKEYLEKIKAQLEADHSIIDLTKIVTEGNIGTSDKIDRIIRYVQTNLTYKAIEFGTKAVIPNGGAKIIGNKYGDCKDHALLVYLMCKAIGIKSYLALANTEFKVAANMPTLEQFNHMIVYLPDFTPNFIDTTNKDLNCRSIPFYLIDNEVLILDVDKPQLIKIHDYNPDDFLIQSIRQVTINPDQPMMIKEHLELSGYFAASLRYNLKMLDPVHYQNSVQYLLSANEPGIVIRNLEVKNLYDLDQNMILELEYQLENHLIKTDHELIISLSALWENYFLNLNNITDRKTPFEIFYPLVLQSQIEVTFNEIYSGKLKTIVTDSQKGKYGNWSLKIDPVDQMYKFDYHCRLTKGVFTSIEYQEFNNFFNSGLKGLTKGFTLIEKK